MIKNEEFTTKKLLGQHMLRFRCRHEATIKLIGGAAELLGKEISVNGELKFSEGYCGSIVTFTGCTLQYMTDTLAEFVVSFKEDQNLPNIYLNISARLEQIRSSTDDGVRGPRLMVCGNESVGKTTLCRILANYAASDYRTVFLIDANVSLNSVSVPGSIAATIVKKHFDVTKGWDIHEDPVTYSFGHLSPMDNLKLFSLQLQNLANQVNITSENDAELFSGGCIINMAGVKYNSDRIEAIQAAIHAFEVDTLLVIEDGYLEDLIRKDIPDYVTVARIPKSSSAIARTDEQWEQDRRLSFASYFHGKGHQRIQPHKLVLSAKDYQLYKIDAKEPQSSLLPAGDNATNEWNQLSLVPFNKTLKHQILALSEANDEDDILGAGAYGFVVVLSVASDDSSITVLSRSNDEPPGNILLITDLKYVDL